jgi:hypothetical protein
LHAPALGITTALSVAIMGRGGDGDDVGSVMRSIYAVICGCCCVLPAIAVPVIMLAPGGAHGAAIGLGCLACLLCLSVKLGSVLDLESFGEKDEDGNQQRCLLNFLVSLGVGAAITCLVYVLVVSLQSCGETTVVAANSSHNASEATVAVGWPATFAPETWVVPGVVALVFVLCWLPVLRDKGYLTGCSCSLVERLRKRARDRAAAAQPAISMSIGWPARQATGEAEPSDASDVQVVVQLKDLRQEEKRPISPKPKFPSPPLAPARLQLNADGTERRDRP